MLFLAHSKNELMQLRGVRRLSVRLSVNFCANRFSQTNGRIATNIAHDGQRASRVKVKVSVKGHVIRALSWILGMSYSVVGGLVFVYLCYLCCELRFSLVAPPLQKVMFSLVS